LNLCRADLVVLKVVDLVGLGIDGRKMVADAAEVPLAPDRPAAIPGATVGQLADLAGCEVEAIELTQPERSL